MGGERNSPPDNVGRPYAGGGNGAEQPAGGTAPAHKIGNNLFTARGVG
jgi:hypothetical protein